MQTMTVEGKALATCVAVAAGNLALMALLAGHPFAVPEEQLTAGSCAIILHGWCAWEIGRLIGRFKRVAAQEAFDARVELRSAAQGLSQGGGAAPERRKKSAQARD